MPVGNPTGTSYAVALAERAGKARVIGPDHFYTLIYGDPEHFPDKGWPRSPDGLLLVGIIFWHRGTEDQGCGGYVCFARGHSEPDRPEWTVVSLEPLTLDPSIECKGQYGCGGTHGHIRNGAWIAC